LTEHIYLLEEISPLQLFGVNNQRLDQLKGRFPEIKFIARGNELTIKGSQTNLLEAKTTVDHLLAELGRRGAISDERYGELLLEEANGSQPRHHHSGEEEFMLHGARGSNIKARTAGQREILRAAAENDIVFALGPAGTGKTYMSVAIAVKALKEKEVKKIILVRPAVEAGENLGFLPGDLKDKVDPYLRPLYDALEDMIHYEKLKAYLEKNVIEIAPLAYMRGRTLSNAFVILDEAQNATEMQFRMFLTRMGRSSKVIITGDESQIDLPRQQRSGLLQGVRILEGVDGIGFVRMNPSDVMRHNLVKKIISAYEKEDERKRETRDERPDSRKRDHPARTEG
jgi:phosphate starvation-inducible PhoH-like protein